MENEEIVLVNNDVNTILNSKTMEENFDAGFKIMGIGMILVFGVLFILYAVVKIMGQFMKKEKKVNEEN